MNLFTFLWDRFLFILGYFISLILTVLVIDMDVLQSHLFLKKETTLYIFVLAMTVLVMFLTIDYLRQWSFYREVNRSIKTKDQSRLFAFQKAITKEQKNLQFLAHQNFQDYMNKLEAYQQQQERHGHFTNQWVHGMKTPVSVIDLLIQESSDLQTVDEAKALFKSIEEENERLAHGLDMILHTARLEKFELDVSIKRVNLVELIRGVINEHKKAMIRYGIFPKLMTQSETVDIETDEKWLAFVLKQFVSNAVKYTPKCAKKKIDFTISQIKDVWQLSIKDEGVGIPSQDLPRVFQPFFTGENGRKGTESTGMGLFLAKEVCERLRHPLDIKSYEGAGTEVTIRFSRESFYHDLLEI